MEIVKVQLSQPPTQYPRMMLVYNEDRGILVEGLATREVLGKMRGREKDFFYAHIDDQKRLRLKERAQWQDW